MQTQMLTEILNKLTLPLPGVEDVLFLLLILALFFETALTTLFNWRSFIIRFEGKAVKTPITVILALAFCLTFKINIMEDLLLTLNQVDKGDIRGFWKQGLTLSFTALLIAGGSDAILRIFKKLSVRDPIGRKNEVLGKKS